MVSRGGRGGARGSLRQTPQGARGAAWPLPVALQVSWAVCPSGTLVTSSRSWPSIVGGTRRSREALTTNQARPLGCTTAEQEAESPRRSSVPWASVSPCPGTSYHRAVGLVDISCWLRESQSHSDKSLKSPPFYCVWVRCSWKVPQWPQGRDFG